MEEFFQQVKHKRISLLLTTENLSSAQLRSSIVCKRQLLREPLTTSLDLFAGGGVKVGGGGGGGRGSSRS